MVGWKEGALKKLGQIFNAEDLISGSDEMNIKKIVLVGLVAEAAAFLVGNILYLNPLVAGIYSSASASYCSKPMDPFGGVVPWLLLMFAGGIVSSILLTLLYSYAEKNLDVKPDWKRGAFFGFLFWLASGLPSAYNTWLLHSYPDAIVLLEAFNGLVGVLIAGAVIGIAYAKIK